MGIGELGRGGAPEDRVIVVGAGLAGVACALHLAPLPVLLVAPEGSGPPASAMAQGGIAAAVAPDDDPMLHACDTLAAGAGLCDPQRVSQITGAAADVVHQLLAWGVDLDRDGDGALAFGLEAAHARARILHAGGDATGRRVLETLLERLRAAAHVTRLYATAERLCVRDNTVTGLWCSDERGRPAFLAARAVVLATGGLGALYASTSNPPGARGGGLALAARAGAVLRDMEFVQFHPTALDVGTWPLPLVTEALRGAGAQLVDEDGEAVMAGRPGGDLAARDVVARAVHARISRGTKVFLDARGTRVSDFPRRFPTVHALCLRHGIDPERDLMPVRPAAHYHMGGIKVDARGRASLSGLYACGEVAATGLHGANRLASNSLLEALACARWIAEDIRGGGAPRIRHSDEESVFSAAALPQRPWSGGALMDQKAGVIRDARSLGALLDVLLPQVAEDDAALVAAFIAFGALNRTESRGGHWRSDFPQSGAPRHSNLTLDQFLAATGLPPREQVPIRPHRNPIGKPLFINNLETNSSIRL